MDVFFIFSSVAFFMWSIRSIFYFVNKWQSIVGEGLTTKSSFLYVFSSFFTPLSFITWLGVIFSIYVSVSDFPLEYDQYFILILFIVKAIVVLKEISNRKFRLPQFNSQVIIIITLSVLLTCVAFAFPFSERYLWLLILDRLLFIFVIIPIFLVMFPAEIIDDFKVRKAIREIRRYKKLQTVLFIGKDSDQIAYYTEQLLQNNKEIVVVRDPYMRMSVIGKTILTDVNDRTEYLFIICQTTTRLDVESILQEISFSTIFLSRAGSSDEQDKLLQKLIPFITKQHRFMIDSSYDNEKLKNKKIKPLFFDTYIDNDKAILALVSLRQKRGNLEINLRYKEEKMLFIVPLIGEYNSVYIIPALLFLFLDGIKKPEIQNTLQAISPIPGQLVEHKLHSGVTILDATLVRDSFVLKQGLNYLKLYKKNKVIVFAIEDEFLPHEIKDLKNELLLATSILVLREKHSLLIRKLMRIGTDKIEVRTIPYDSVRKLVRNRLLPNDIVLFIGEKASPIIESIILSSSTTQ
ncbi:hypothetical protein BH09PAT1_BH09PAT1_2680 [soil metagenome]